MNDTPSAIMSSLNLKNAAILGDFNEEVKPAPAPST
jgi:hypothetical protein